MNNTKTLKAIVVMLSLALIVLVAWFGWYYQKQTSSNLDNNKNIVATSTPKEVTASTTTIATKALLTALSTEPFLNLLSPRGGENLCIGDNLDIGWKGSQGLNTVDIYLQRGSVGNSTTYPLGSFPVSYNETGEQNGEGSYPWKVGYSKAGIKMDPDETYRIVLNGCYPNAENNRSCKMLINTSNSFNILDCRG